MPASNTAFCPTPPVYAPWSGMGRQTNQYVLKRANDNPSVEFKAIAVILNRNQSQMCILIHSSNVPVLAIQSLLPTLVSCYSIMVEG